MRKVTLILLACLLCCGGAWAQYGKYWRTVVCDTALRQGDPSGEWQLVFHDEFSGTRLDTLRWSPCTGLARDFQFESQKAWHLPDNAVVENGLLKIFVRRQHMEGMRHQTNWEWTQFDTSDFDYTTAEIWTRQLFGYGRYEAKIRLPRGVGFWPAFWLYSNNGRYNEIDIFEFWNEYRGDRLNRNRLTAQHHMTVHYDPLGDGQIRQHGTSYNGRDFYSQFHIYTLIYTPFYIRWLVDDEVVWEYYRFRDFLGNNQDAATLLWGHHYRENMLFPRDPMYIILNVAVQSGADAPDDTTPLPAAMEVDWVRYYR